MVGVYTPATVLALCDPWVSPFGATTVYVCPVTSEIRHLHALLLSCVLCFKAELSSICCEASTPNQPVQRSGATGRLRTDFSRPCIPHGQSATCSRMAFGFMSLALHVSCLRLVPHCSETVTTSRSTGSSVRYDTAAPTFRIFMPGNAVFIQGLGYEPACKNCKLSVLICISTVLEQQIFTSSRHEAGPLLATCQCTRFFSVCTPLLSPATPL